MVDKTTGDNSQPTENQGTGKEPNKYLTEEEVNYRVNAAITGRMKAFDKQLESITAVLARLAPPEEPEKQPSKMSQMEKQVELLTKERDQERQINKSKELRRQVTEKLTAKGVDASLLKPALATLIDADKVVDYDEDDQIVFKTPTGNLNLELGISNYLKSDGKIFLPLKGTSGTGAKSPGAPKTQPKMSDSDLATALVGLTRGNIS